MRRGPTEFREAAALITPIEAQRRAAVEIAGIHDRLGRVCMMRAGGFDVDVLESFWLTLLLATPDATTSTPTRPKARVAAFRARRTAAALRGHDEVPKSVDLLFVAQMPTHPRLFAPLLKLISARGRSAGIVCLDERTAAAATVAGFRDVRSPLSLGPVATMLAVIRVRRWWRSAVRSLRDLGWLGSSVAAAADARVRPQLAGWAVAVEVLARSLSTASTVVCANPYAPFGRAAGLLAREARVKTFGLQHGSIFPDDPRWQRPVVDRMLVWGEPSKRDLVASGWAPDDVIVCGAPHLDAWHMKDATRPPHLLVATSGPGDRVSLAQHRSFLRLLSETIRSSSPDMHWVIKLHRKDRAQHYLDEGFRFGDGPVDLVDAASGVAIEDLLPSARLLVTQTSTTALDAALHGVPVAIVPPEGDASDVEFITRSAAWTVTEAKSLALAAEAAWNAPPGLAAARHDFISEYFGPLNGSAERVVSALLEGR